MTQGHRDHDQDTIEFDSYAHGYAPGMDSRIKKWVGASFESFIRVKVKWLLHDLEHRPIGSSTSSGSLKLLDFGCGTGELLQGLRNYQFQGELEGCDISNSMLEEAKTRFGSGPLPLLHLVTPGELPFPENSYDVVVASSVFHHVSPSARAGIFAELLRVLKPSGRLVVFEHNPFNPLTVWLVRRTDIDRDAELVRPSHLSQSIESVGFSRVRTQYTMFFPPRFQALDGADRLFAWLPLGGQYAVTAEKAMGDKSTAA